MIPSAPTAMAALVSGKTRSRRPPECDGSTITGRCDRRWATGTALMSSVLRVAVSNVRMPRSQRTMSRLPRWAMYSAAISHSSIVAFMPRLSMTGLPAEPTAWSSAKFCMLRVPTWSMSACSLTRSTLAGSTTSVTTGSPTSALTSARIFRPATPRPWNAYGEVRGLKAPPRSRDAPARLAMRAAASVCSGVSTVQGPAIRVKVDGPDQPDDRAGDPAADEGLAAGRPDQRHNRVDISLSYLGSHHDHHLFLLGPAITTKKPPAVRPGAWSSAASALAQHLAGRLPGAG